MRRVGHPLFLARLFFVPGDLLYFADQENPGESAGHGDRRHDDEGPVEVAGAVEDEAGDGWSRDAGEIADEILEAGPAARGLGAGEGLRDGPDVRAAYAEENYAEDDRGNAVAWAADYR